MATYSPLSLDCKKYLFIFITFKIDRMQQKELMCVEGNV